MRVIKCKLKNILDPNIDYYFLYSIINKANKNIFICYHFIRSYILYCYNNKKNIPEINVKFILTCFKAISKNSRGPKNNNNLFKELKQYYINNFCPRVFNETNEVDSKNLSYIYGEIALEMVTSYKNNIELNFYKYLSQFINQYFKDNKKIKENKSILWKIKKDIIKGTLNSDKEYHKWINKYSHSKFFLHSHKK